MRCTILLLTILAAFACFIEYASATPGFFEKLFGYSSSGYGGGYGGYGGGGYGGGGYGGNGYGGGYGGYRPRPTGRQGGGRSYKDICRVINADNYAAPRAAPFPAQPFCPY